MNHPFGFVKSLRIFFVSVLLLCLPLPATADDVTDSISEALEQYQTGDYAGAIGSLNYASQLIGQKKGEALETVFPAPLPGWNADKATSQAAGAAMFGGGITAEKVYTREDSDIRINIITDSPMLQGMMMMFNNPMFAAADGGKLEKISGQKAIVTYDVDNRNGEVKIVVANRFLITVTGNNVDQKELRDYTAAFDFNKLASLP